MMTGKRRMQLTATCLIALATLGGIANAQSTTGRGHDSDVQPGGASVSRAEGRAEGRYEAAANKHVNDAVGVVREMEADSRMKNLLQQARGVFIVPTYGRAALGVGASGGAGVLLVKRDDTMWSDPVFYNIGGVNVGAQAGAEGGAIVMVLNNEKAVNVFMQKNHFSLSADAGLTVVNWAKVAQGSVGTGDVVAWAATKGLFGDVITVGINDIRFNEYLTDAYYRTALSAKDVVTGTRKNPQADTLKSVLASASTGTPASGSSGGGAERSSSGEVRK